MKIALIACAALALTQPSCVTLSDSTKKVLSDTGKELVRIGADMAKDYVLNKVADKASEVPWLHSLVAGARSVETPSATASTFAKATDAFAKPADSKYDALIKGLTSAFANSTAPPAERIEALAQGVERAALQASR